MRNCDFSEAKVGDRVWDFQYGWGVIDAINKEVGISFPISIWFDIEEIKSFDFKGRLTPKAKPTLFWNEFEIPKEAFEKPKPKLEVDDLVWVWDKGECESSKRIMCFCGFTSKGLIKVYSNGYSSEHINVPYTVYDHWELYEPKIKDMK